MQKTNQTISNTCYENFDNFDYFSKTQERKFEIKIISTSVKDSVAKLKEL